MVDIPTARRRNPRKLGGEGVQSLPCDRNRTKHATICYHSRRVRATFFFVSKHIIVLSRYDRYLFVVNICLCVVFNLHVHGKRAVNTCSGFSLCFDLRFFPPPPLSLSPARFFFLFLLCLSLSELFFTLPLPPPFSRLLPREVCFASDYYLPRSESTAGLWYTGSMVSRYTPATATSVPSGNPCVFPFPPAQSAVGRPRCPAATSLPRCPLTTPLSYEPCFAAPLVLPPRFARETPGTYQASVYRNAAFLWVY